MVLTSLFYSTSSLDSIAVFLVQAYNHLQFSLQHCCYRCCHPLIPLLQSLQTLILLLGPKVISFLAPGGSRFFPSQCDNSLNLPQEAWPRSGHSPSNDSSGSYIPSSSIYQGRTNATQSSQECLPLCASPWTIPFLQIDSILGHQKALGSFN